MKEKYRKIRLIEGLGLYGGLNFYKDFPCIIGFGAILCMLKHIDRYCHVVLQILLFFYANYSESWSLNSIKLSKS